MSNCQGEPVLCQLYGVLVHSGFSCNSGHYYCYVRAPNGTWYEMNDNRVAQVGLQTVLRAQAYILFYMKNKPTTSASAANTAIKTNHPAKSDVQLNGHAVKDKVGILKSTQNRVSQTTAPNSQMKSNIPPIGVKVGALPPRTEIKPFGISSVTNMAPGNSLGVLKKKPKINWTQNNIQTEKVPVENVLKNVSSLNSAAASKPNTQSTSPPVRQKEVVLNGLQKLSESYGDSDGASGDSRKASPPSSKPTATSNRDKA